MNERNTKTRTGTDVKNKREIPQRAWANLNDQTRCPVEAYKLYKSKRPVNFSKPEDPFYIQENTNPNKSTRWYKSQIVGISGHRNIQSISSYSKLNPSKHKEIASCILGGCDDRIQASQTLVTIDNNVGERNVHQTTTTFERQISVGQGHAAPAGLNYIFGAPIYGGTFNINIQSVPDNNPQQRKRRRSYLQ
ncbi:Hypothetical predicted protein [Mytilus galloprovincialis]|uniref:ZMYM2-like/QRICH1 C-terminal domain-containing protein n=1 Tax=Mytilus galloprovincialis TaxID=29158 RepID=A0A8B6CJ87_MYTGA|nr:Hypothetical predicted protein [Mytilus galloprovincialis]